MREPEHGRREATAGSPLASLMETLFFGRQQLRNAKQGRPTIAPPETPVPGTHAALVENMRWSRELPGVRSLASPDYGACERAWKGAVAAVEQRHGLRLSLDPSGQPSALAVRALEAVRGAESMFLKLSGSRGASKATVDQAFGRFTEAMAAWLTIVSTGVPSAAERRRQQQREEAWR